MYLYIITILDNSIEITIMEQDSYNKSNRVPYTIVNDTINISKILLRNYQSLEYVKIVITNDTLHIFNTNEIFIEETVINHEKEFNTSISDCWPAKICSINRLKGVYLFDNAYNRTLNYSLYALYQLHITSTSEWSIKDDKEKIFFRFKITDCNIFITEIDTPFPLQNLNVDSYIYCSMDRLFFKQKALFLNKDVTPINWYGINLKELKW